MTDLTQARAAARDALTAANNTCTAPQTPEINEALDALVNLLDTLDALDALDVQAAKGEQP